MRLVWLVSLVRLMRLMKSVRSVRTVRLMRSVRVVRSVRSLRLLGCLGFPPPPDEISCMSYSMGRGPSLQVFFMRGRGPKGEFVYVSTFYIIFGSRLLNFFFLRFL